MDNTDVFKEFLDNLKEERERYWNLASLEEDHIRKEVDNGVVNVLDKVIDSLQKAMKENKDD